MKPSRLIGGLALTALLAFALQLRLADASKKMIARAHLAGQGQVQRAAAPRSFDQGAIKLLSAAPQEGVAQWGTAAFNTLVQDLRQITAEQVAEAAATKAQELAEVARKATAQTVVEDITLPIKALSSRGVFVDERFVVPGELIMGNPHLTLVAIAPDQQWIRVRFNGQQNKKAHLNEHGDFIVQVERYTGGF